MNKPFLSARTQEEINSLLLEQMPHWQKYNLKQVYNWIYLKYEKEIENWTDLSKQKRIELQEKFVLSPLTVADHVKSAKGDTDKFLFQISDEQNIESVLMRFRDRTNLTACISSQVGCSVGCPFCATGKLGFKRNLEYWEIVEQVLSIQRLTGEKIQNLVFMGQGEPLLNLENLVQAIKLFRYDVGISVRKITVSTSGIVPQIYELAKREIPINLAISLHSPEQTLRERLVPVAKRWDLNELMKSLHYFFDKTKRRITFEYTLLKDVNDSREYAQMLCNLMRDLSFPCLINLIPYNPTCDDFEKPNDLRVEEFKRIVEKSGRKTTVRLTMGDDISAACGQLASKKLNSN